MRVMKYSLTRTLPFFPRGPLRCLVVPQKRSWNVVENRLRVFCVGSVGETDTEQSVAVWHCCCSIHVHVLFRIARLQQSGERVSTS